MYILIRKSFCPNLKIKIMDKIESSAIRTWQFVVEEEKERLMHTSDEQYEDVVLRFIKTTREGILYTKVLPTVRAGVQDVDKAESHFGIVLGRFAELLNCHFNYIESYETVL